MLPVLARLGPWHYSVIPLIFAIILALIWIWQWVEARYSHRPLVWTRLAGGAAVAAVLAVAVFFAVNRAAPVEIKSWGTMLVVAFAVGTFYLARWGDKRVVSSSDAVDLSLFCLIGAIIGARLIFVVLDWNLYAGHPAKLLDVWQGGLSFHGGLLGAVIAGLLFAHFRHKNFWAIADETAPGIALGFTFARFGCFLNGCCYGHACNLPWAMVFPYSAMPHTRVHPTQLYSMVMSLIIFAILLKLRGKLPRHGHLFGAYLAIYSVGRYLMEITRAGATGRLLTFIPWMTVAQLASIIIFVIVVTIMALTWKKPAKATAAPKQDDAQQANVRAHRR